MNKSRIVEKVTYRPHLKDYTYVVLFFLISSFFAFFVIKPVLSIAFTLKREAADLAKVDAVYEKNILNLVEIQSKMERIRDRMYLLDEAMPTRPVTRGIIAGVNQAASEQGMIISAINLSPIDLKSDKKDVKPLSLSIAASGDFSQVNNFIKSLMSQRRIKTIEAVKITRVGEGAEGGANLRIQMTIQAYYL